MKLTNDDLYMISLGLTELSQIKLTGALALQVFREKKKIDDILSPALQAIENVEEAEEKKKIASEEIEIDLKKFNLKDFESVVDLKPTTLFKLEKILEVENGIS